MDETIMDGIWIINVGHEVGKLNPCHVIIGVLLGIFAAIIIFWIIEDILISIFDIDTSNYGMSILCALLITFGGIAGGWTGAMVSESLTTGDTTYDIVVGDNVLFNEFHKQYEIISQNGNIYTVKEKIK